MKYGAICLSDVERPLNFMMNKRSHNVVCLFGPAMSSAIFQQVPIYRAIRPLIKALFNCWHQMDRWQYGDDLG